MAEKIERGSFGSRRMRMGGSAVYVTLIAAPAVHMRLRPRVDIGSEAAGAEIGTAPTSKHRGFASDNNRAEPESLIGKAAR